jgi:hypothetical protein
VAQGWQSTAAAACHGLAYVERCLVPTLKGDLLELSRPECGTVVKTSSRRM